MSLCFRRDFVKGVGLGAAAVVASRAGRPAVVKLNRKDGRVMKPFDCGRPPAVRRARQVVDLHGKLTRLAHLTLSVAVVCGTWACALADELRWQPFEDAPRLALTGRAFTSQPVVLKNPMLSKISEKIYRLPWAPGEAMVLRLRPDTHAVQAFGFWAGPNEFCLIARDGNEWRQVTPGHTKPAAKPELAYFGHRVSGQTVKWTRPPCVLVMGDVAQKHVEAKRVRLWDAGCTEMVLRRGEREIEQGRRFLGWAKKPHPDAKAAVEAAAQAIENTRAQLKRETNGLLDAYMALPEPRYALEVMAYLSRIHHRRGRLKQIGFADAWEAMFYGRPEFGPCVSARKTAQQALWSERPETLAAEARDVFGKDAQFAISITHGLTKFRRDRPFPEALKAHVRMSLARGEHESFQIVVASFGKAISNARVSIEWEGDGPHPGVTFRPVGYVKTRPDPDNLAEYVGWWPDPLMPPAPVDVAPGETQPIWGSVHATMDTATGDHHARLTVLADGMPPLRCELTAHVFDFDLGFTHLPSLLSLRLDSIKRFYKLEEVSQAARRRWYAFCLEYRMNPNNIYATDFIPGEEDLDFCVKRGLNAMVMHARPIRRTTRNSRDNVEVWISDDNKLYREVEGDWALTHDGDGRIVIRELDVTARYVKVHSRLTDKKHEFAIRTLEPGRIVAFEGEREFTGPAGWIGPDDGTKALRYFGATWGAALDHERASIGVDLGQRRHVTKVVLTTGTRLEQVRRFSELAKQHGLGDRAYVYGFDEWADVERYGDIVRTYGILKAAAPGIKACSTVVHPVDPIKGTIDAWCPCLCYNYAGYEEARKRGQEVWYYAGGTPYDPFPTHELLDVPAVEARAFFWVAWRYQYTGWLHWELNVWRHNMEGDKRWPRAPWNPARNGVRNGEVGRIYPGPNVTPLPSVRLENMRDGIEDYDYFWLLNEALRKLPSGDPRRAAGQKLIEESIRTLCRSRADFERDPDRILQIHERLGRAIEDLM